MTPLPPSPESVEEATERLKDAIYALQRAAQGNDPIAGHDAAKATYDGIDALIQAVRDDAADRRDWLSEASTVQQQFTPTKRFIMR